MLIDVDMLGLSTGIPEKVYGSYHFIVQSMFLLESSPRLKVKGSVLKNKLFADENCF